MKEKTSKLELEKFEIHKLNNLSKIIGGDDGTKNTDKEDDSTGACWD